MRVGQIVSDFVRWRWAPFVGLVSASLLYVLLAILIVPSRVGASESEHESDVEGVGPREAHPAAEESEPERPEPDTLTRTRPTNRINPSSAAPRPPVVQRRRGFSPPLERPDPTPPPAAPAPAPPPPPTAAPPPPAPPAPTPPPVQPLDPRQQGLARAARAATRAAGRASRLTARNVVEQPADDDDDDDADDNDSAAASNDEADDDETPETNDNDESDAEAGDDDE